MARWQMRGWRIGVIVAAVGAASYPLVWRRRCLTWGATAREVDAELPGDACLPVADVVSTRAITVDAPPSAVWPWLVQMGSGRGGAYTYDWIENLFGLDMHSADRILPEFQHLAVGDAMPVGANGPRLRVQILDVERALVVQSEDDSWVWALIVAPAGAATRLISRNRISLVGMPAVSRLAYMAVMESGSLLMERKMLIGIKTRAERSALEHHRDSAGEPGA